MTEDEPQGVSLGDGWTVADEEWHRQQVGDDYSTNGAGPTPSLEVLVEPLGVFRGVEEVTSEALLGTRTESILPADGIILMYGDGGAGKTTLTIDAAFHMAGARNWLGLEVERPVPLLVIENEGPRGMFRRILNDKAETWSESLDERIHVLAEPWSRFTVADAAQRDAIAEVVNERALDAIILGPLATVGMVGGGTPDEISAFEGKLRDLRSLIDRPVAFWIVHHENKAGDVSGAWERVPDTLIHVQAAGNGHTRLVFQKARWSSEYHGTSLNLSWSEGRTFHVVEDVERDYYSDVLAVFDDDLWRTVDEIRREAEIGTTSCRSVLNELVRRGDLTFAVGPAGRHATAHCYRRRSADVMTFTIDDE